MEHAKDADKEILYLSSQNNTTNDINFKECKMLWFAAMHESEQLCEEGSFHKHNTDYSVALNSALKNAYDSLQPVLVLGRYGMTNENSTDHKKLGTWAIEKGVKVIYSPKTGCHIYRQIIYKVHF